MLQKSKFFKNLETRIRLASWWRHFVHPHQLWSAIKFSGHFYIKFKQEEKIQFQDALSVVLIIKNEASYLAEWIEYHKMVGVTKFYIYDNESTDNIKDVLSHYKDDVIYKYWPGRGQQISAYNDALKNYKLKTKWMAFIDTDEFLVPVQHETVVDVINEIKPKYGLGASWVNYGNSGYLTRTPGLTIERFTRRAPLDHPKNLMVKSIINPRAAFMFAVHNGCFLGFRSSIDENGRRIAGFNLKPSIEKIRVNHYFTKSYEEFLNKKKRGDVETPDGKFNKSFDEGNTNDIYDDIMLKYVPKIKLRLEQKGLLTR